MATKPRPVTNSKQAEIRSKALRIRMIDCGPRALNAYLDFSVEDRTLIVDEFKYPNDGGLLRRIGASTREDPHIWLKVVSKLRDAPYDDLWWIRDAAPPYLETLGRSPEVDAVRRILRLD
jgi:hypothetical protein